MTRPGLFITGTDTGVRKTFISSLLLRAFREWQAPVGYFKPLQTGSDSDTEETRRLSPEAAREWAEPVYHLPLPAAPLRSAMAAGIEIAPARVMAEWKRLAAQGVWVVEGAGGLRVPIAAGFTTVELIRELGIPALLVASTRLGTINHTLLSVECLEREGIPLAGIVLSGPQDPGLVGVLEQFSKARIVAEIPQVENFDDHALELLAREVFPEKLLRRLLPAAFDPRLMP